MAVSWSVITPALGSGEVEGRYETPISKNRDEDVDARLRILEARLQSLGDRVSLIKPYPTSIGEAQS